MKTTQIISLSCSVALLASAGLAQTNVFPSAGNVGIGTTSPTSLLQVGADVGVQAFKVGVSGNLANANAEIRNNLAAVGTDATTTSEVGAVAWNYYNGGNSPSWSGALLRFNGTSVTAPAYGYGLPSANAGSLYFQNVSAGVIASNGANIFISPAANPTAAFLASGKVGIGTTSPTSLLQVGDTVGAQAFKVGVTGNMANANAEIRNNLAAVGIDANSTSELGAVAWNYYNGGNSPSWSGAMLRFNGTGVSAPALGYGLPPANAGILVFQNVSRGVVATTGNANLYFSPGGNAAVSILTNGSVGIGTTSPDKPLTVKGTIHASEVIVDTAVAASDVKIRPSSWADDVFDEGRQLTPLTEVEQQIKTNRHLPGIPSATEVAANGVSLAEMQTKLLAKVEELTLRLIEQDKRIQKLESENAQLRSR